MTSVGVGAWVAFHVLVLGMLAIDLGLLSRRPQGVITKREALIWSIVWVMTALLFALGIDRTLGGEKSLEFLTGYLIEKSLSVDNLFVFLVIFSSFGVPPRLQRLVLVWGVIGALVMRAVFILAGAALLQRFHWLMYVLGLFLVVTAIRLLKHDQDEKMEPGQHPVVRFLQRLIPISGHYDGEKFFSRQDGRLMATPLLVVLAVIECSDLVFAMDSIPAIFAITMDPFIVYTSNVFAILGLRALFFLLAGVMGMFRFMKEGLAVVLGFVGLKMLLADFLHIPIVYSLGFIALALSAALAASLLFPAPPPPDEGEAEPDSESH